MPIFYKQDGTWKNVDSPYIKQNGQWVQPEQVYIKKNGRWKLIWEEFAFVVETVNSFETQNATVLEGQLSNFEDFGPDETFFFDQTLDEPITVEAVAVDEDRKLIALGGGDDTVYVYNNRLALERTTESPISKVDVVETLQEPSETINGIDFYDSKNLVVASDSLYVYDENSNVVNTFTTDEGNEYTDVDVNSQNGTIAASTGGAYVYLYTEQGDGTWAFDQKLNNPLSGIATSVSWKEDDGSLGVGTNQGQVYVYDNTFNPGDAQLIDQFTGNTKIEFSELGTDGVSNWLAVVDEQELKVYSNGLNLAATITDSTEGPQGDVTWDENDYLAHASSDDRLYVYNGSNGSFDNFKTFDDPSESASRPFKSVSWDSQNEYIVGGTSKSGSGNAHLFSTGVRMFFDWSKQGEGFANRQRASGLRAVGTFETTLDNLEPNQAYEFRAGGYSADGRTVLDENGLTFVTVDLQVETEPVSSRQSTSATLNGKVTSFDRNSENPFVEFRYGKASEDLRNVQNIGFISPNAPTEVSFNLTNLKSGQEYEYRIVSEFGGVTSFGDVETFTTRNVTAALSSAVTDPTDFGDRFISSDTEAETSTEIFTIIETTGTGSYSVAENDVTISGQDAGDFTLVTASGSFPLSVSKDNPRDIKVEFSPTEDELQVANLEITHNAANGINPFDIGLQGTGELVPELQLEDNVVEAIVDGNEDTAQVFIRETGRDYDATITNISENPNQPAGTDTSKWSISDLPGDLSSGGTATVPAGGTVSFTVGFDPDTNSPQDYNVIVDYKGSGIRDDTVLNGTITGNIRGSIKAEFDPQRNGNVEDTSFNFDTVTSDGGTYVRDSSGPDVTTTVPFKIPGDSLGDFQVIELRIVDGDNPSDFTILNVPSEVQDGDPTTSVNVSETNELLFDVEFNPSAQNERNTNIEVVANNVKTSPVSINLTGTGLQPSEIVTDVTSLTFGDTIVGGNLSGERSIESVTVSNPSGDETFDVTNDSIISSEFNIETSIAGETLGENFASPVKEQVDAEIEFIPTGGTDGETVTAQYEIANNAEIGNDPVFIDLEGTVQITSLDFQTADGTSFDPTIAGPHFSVFGVPGQSASRDFEVSVLSENTASTVVSISGSNSGILNLGSDQQSELNPGGAPLVGTMNYNPTSTSDDGTTEQVTVEWDNSNESETIQVEALIKSTIDVQTPDAGSSGDGTLDFGSIIETNSKSLTVTVSEVVGNRDFDITTLGSLSSTGGRYSITDNFATSAPVTVSTGTSASATVDFSPSVGDGGNTYTNTFSFEHGAAYAQSAYEESPVNITLTADVLASTSIVLTQDSDGSTPINYSAEAGNTESVLINISEDGGNNSATIDSFTVSDDGDGTAPFSLNSGYSNFGTTVPAGGSISEAVVEFAPSSGTGSAPDFIVNGELTANYSGTGVPSGASSSVSLQGEVIKPAIADISSSTNTPISFGSITVDPGNTVTETREYTIVEENLKNSYNVTGITVTGTESGSYTNLTNAPSGNDIASGDTVSAGGSLTGTVEFFFDSSTQSSGTYNATIELSHDAPQEGSSDTGSTSGVLEIPVFADVTVAQYGFTVTPTSHDFGTTGNPATKQFIIENTGNQTLSGFSVGSFSNQFLTKTSTIGTTTLDPGQTTSFTVEYDPVNETDTANETITVSDSDPNTSDVDVTVQGDGFANKTVSINPVSGTDFGNDGGTKDFEINNTGNVDIVVSTSLQTGTEFSITSGNLSNQTISPSETPPTVTVSYTPSTIDSDTDTLLVSGDASDSQNISGDGITETVDVSTTPNSLSFGTTDPAGNTVSVTVENSTNANVDATNLGVSLSTDSDPEFSIPNGISGSISPGSSKSFDVEYNPNTFNANDSGTAEVVYDDASQVQQTISVGLSGSGETESSLSVTTDNLGTVVNSSTTKTVTDAVTVSNSSTANRDASFTVTNVNGATGEINILTGQFSTPIASGGQTSADVEYSPSDNTNDSITFDISSGDEPNPPSNVTLSGSGVSDQPSISISPSSHDFGSSGGSQTFDVTNNGNTSLSNVSVNITGTDSGDFSKDSTLGTTSLSVGQTEQVTIGYNPSTASTDDASLDASGDGSGQTATDFASLSGDGLVAGFVQSVTAPGDVDVEKNNTNSGNTGTVTFGGETSVSYSVNANAGTNTTANVVSGGSGTVDPTVTSSASFSVDVTGDSAGSDTITTSADTKSDTFNANVYLDPAPSIDNFTFGVQTGNSTSQTNTVTNVGTGTNSDLTVTNASLNAGASSELSISRTGKDVTVSADASSASGGETYSGTVTVTDDGASSALENEDTDTADVTVNVGTDPQISIPNTITFDANANATTTTTVSISNSGTGSINPTSASISGDNELSASLINSGSDVEITASVGSNVSDTTSFTGTLTVTGSNSSDTGSVTANVVTDPSISITPANYDFFTGSGNKQFTIENTGDVDLASISASGLSGDFSESGVQDSTRSPGQTTTVTVNYNPNDTTSDSDTLNISTDTTASASANVSGNGQPVQDAISCNMDNNGDFGTGGGTATFTVVAESTNNVDITGISSSVSGTDFSEATSLSNVTLSPGQQTSFDVDYSPGDTSNDSGTASINADNASCSIPLSGNGQPVDATLTLNLDNNGDFGTGGGNATATVSAPISNNVDITGVSKSVSNDSGSEFSSSGSISSTFRPGDSETFTVSYNPGDVNSDNGDVSVSGSESTSDSVPLSGNGQAVSADINISLGNGGSFGTASGTATTTATVSTPPSNNVDIDNVSTNVANDSGSEFSSSGSVSSTFSPNQSETFTVEYNPSDASGDNGDASVSGSENASDSVPLSGDGEPVSADISISLDNNGDFGTGASDTGGTVSAPTSNNVDVTTDGISLSGNDFNQLGDTTGNVLSPGGSQSFNTLVSYDPSDTSDDSGTVTIDIQENSNDDSVQLSGSGQAATVDLVISSGLSISDTNAGGTATGSVTIRNDGNADSSTLSPTISAPQGSGSISNLSISPDGDGIATAGGGTATFSVSADVNAGASDQTTVEIEVSQSGATNSPTSSTFNVNNYDLSLTSPTLGDVTDSGTTTDTIQLQNNGSISYNLTTASASASASPSASANVSGFSTSGTISSGGSEQFTVTSDPDESQLNDGDSVTVNVDVSDSSSLNDNQSVSESYTFNVSPTPDVNDYSLGDCEIGTDTSLSQTVGNTGGGSLSVSSASASVDGGSAAGGSMSASNVAGDTVEVTYSAPSNETDGTSVSGTVTISFDSYPSITRNVSGTIAAPVLGVSSTLSFGSGVPDVQSGTQVSGTATIENTGSADANVTAGVTVVGGSVSNDTDSMSVSLSSGTISSNGGTVDLTVNVTPSSSAEGTSINPGANVTASSNGDQVTPNAAINVISSTASVSTGLATVSSGTLGPEATLNGSVTDYGPNSSLGVAFEYRQQGSVTWSQTTTQNVSPPTASFLDTASGLLQNVTYEYRAVIITATGNTDDGAIQTFSTGSSTDGGTDSGTDSGTDTPIAAGIDVDDPNIEPGIEPLDDEEQNNNDDEDPNDDNQNE